MNLPNSIETFTSICRSPRRQLSFWAGVVMGFGAGVFFMCFAVYMIFNGKGGL